MLLVSRYSTLGLRCASGEKNLRAIVKGWNVDDYLSYQTELRICVAEEKSRERV